MLPHITSEQWREDLRYLADYLRCEHRNPFHAMSPEAFDTSVRALHLRILALANHEVVVEFARLVALIGDGHTALRLNEVPNFRRYPIELYRFSDGLFVRAIACEHEAAAGARLMAIDETPAHDAYEAMRPLVSRDNEMGMTATAPIYLGIPEVLHARGVVSKPEQAVFTVQLPSGEAVPLTLKPTPTPSTRMVDAHDSADVPVPLWLRRQEENWHEYLPANRTLYVAYNRVRDSTDEHLVAFFDRIFTVIRQESVDRLVLDIRLNHGGNNLLNRPLIHHLIRCDRINRWGSLFAIIGRGTFSAAMNLAVDLERHTRVLFVGEPTGASPNHYGENGAIVLHHSGLEISVSTLWWQYSDPYDDRPWIAPDLPARLSSVDYMTNRDPAVDAALRYLLGSTPPVEYPDRLTAQLRRDDLRLERGDRC
jgi:hypothetical protein